MDLATAVRAAGVVGAGGAGFPTHLKLAGGVETVIVNGAECEPLLRVDQELMAAEHVALVEALANVLAAVGAARGVFALKRRYAAAEEALHRAIASRPGIDLFLLDDFYPAGDEHVLVHEVTDRTVPAGGIPLAVGAVVLNVETLLNIGRAARGEPVITKHVTVAGAVARPATFAVPVGITLAELVSLAGGATTPSFGLIVGGPLMGRPAAESEVVTKTTKGVIVLPGDHPLLQARRVPLGAQIRRAASCCCGCRMCTDLCPRHLLGHPLAPHRTLNAATHGLVDSAAHYTPAYLCSECGLCDAFACPMGLSPRSMHTELKKELARAGVPNPYRGQMVTPRPERAWRLVPAGRLISRLGLARYDRPAPLVASDYVPAKVRILLRQGAGAAAVPVVRPGDYVYRGQCVAEPPPGQPGASHHASIDGRVSGVAEGIEIEAV